MTSMRSEPCTWELSHCGEAGGECSSLSSLDPAVADIITRTATSYLWNWTGRQFGTCPVTIRPCRDSCRDFWTTYRGRSGVNRNIPWYEGGNGPLQPALINGEWFNLGCGGSCNTDPCSCTYVPTVTLAGPVASVSEVKINGSVLSPAAYRVDNHAYLVRTDGGDWPVCQDMTSDPDDPGSDSFEVTYNLGVAVPAGGQLAAGVLACELAKAACGNASCKLPQRLQSITRQGVTMTVLDSYGSMYEYGTTGLFVVDSWVGSILASNRRSGMRVASPDRRPPRRST